MLEYVLIVFLVVGAVWYLCRRFRNSFRGGDCGCGCGGCAKEAEKGSCCSIASGKENEKKN